MAFLARDKVEAIGFASIGNNVFISDKASFYGVTNIAIGDQVRIDDFCVISAGRGGIKIGNHVHIAVGCSLIGVEKIELADFSGLSSRVSIYSSSDDYSGEFMTNPMVPQEFTGVTHSAVTLEKHVIVGSGSVILPGVTLHEGAAVGSLSLVNRDCDAFGIYAGNPARKIKERKRDLLMLAARLMQSRADLG